MNTQITPSEINYKQWENHWNSMTTYLRDNLLGKDTLIIKDEFSIGVYRNRRCFSVYGAEDSFKFGNNNKVIIKVENKRTGKFVKVFEFLIDTKEIKKCSQAHIIFNSYDAEELKFIRSLCDTVSDYYRPDSIKFITDNF